MTLCIKKWQLKLASFIKDARTEWVNNAGYKKSKELLRNISSLSGDLVTLAKFQMAQLTSQDSGD